MLQTTVKALISGLSGLVFERVNIMKRIVSILQIIFILQVAPVGAATIALFPFEDFSTNSGIGAKLITEIVSSQVELAGHVVVCPAELNDFMGRHRIRQYGVISSEQAQLAQKELGIDYILLGSVMLKEERQTTATASIFTLVRAADAHVVWSYVDSYSLADHQAMFNLSGPSNLEDLWTLLALDAFAELPEIMLANLLPEQESGNIIVEHSEPNLQIDFAAFHPRHVKPGENVNCSVRFRTLNISEEGEPTVFIKVGSRVHTAQTDDGFEYEVSWVATEGNPGPPFKLAMNDPDLFYRGMWDSENLEAGYPVNIVVEWPSGRHDELYIGSYIVDSTPPDLKLIASAKEYNNRKIFRQRLPLTVRWGRPEKVDRWKLAVYDQENKQVISTKGTAEPPASFLWKGTNSSNKKAEEGLYSVVLQVWDLAGNRTVSTEEVYYLPELPEVELTPVVSPEDESIQLALFLDHEPLVPLKYWRLEVWASNNDLLSFHEGTNFPESITLAALDSINVDDDIDAKLMVLDELGGEMVTSFKGLYAMAAALQEMDQTQDDTQKSSGSGWDEGF